MRVYFYGTAGDMAAMVWQKYRRVNRLFVFPHRSLYPHTNTHTPPPILTEFSLFFTVISLLLQLNMSALHFSFIGFWKFNYFLRLSVFQTSFHLSFSYSAHCFSLPILSVSVKLLSEHNGDSFSLNSPIDQFSTGFIFLCMYLYSLIGRNKLHSLSNPHI